MDVIAVDDPTDAQIRQWHSVLLAVHADDPADDPVPEPEQTAARLLGAEQGSRQRLWAALEDGEMTAVAALRLPGAPGADRPAEIDIQVRPDRRRHGLGSALLHHAAEGLRADRRSSVIAQVSAATPAVPFLESHGFECVLTLKGLLLHLSDVPPGRVKELIAAGPVGYDLVHWQGAVPDEYALALARAKHAMADMQAYEGVPWDADRVREMAEMVNKRGDALYTVAAVQGTTVAGFTEVVVSADDPYRAAQYDTAVVPEHRGRRLGIWVKAAMLDWLSRERPEVREIETDNAGDNVHMLAVNEELGYRRQRETREYQASASVLP
ncbi:GNAT family N-acetyltransferase [Actinomadura barringtoniae]|uniref:GNAT family N-acetyltransferase n=1 Tax=Actinomadura barringtoniae TaxID=1427535 RepID=A0A939PI57_9ACTN|nr:GNAT family N-acetyltransferase [Actinomadura barringtoniae]MBO2453342.1 GNAT family N-acetyltransferase [Actinomadura barringtoniae]